MRIIVFILYLCFGFVLSAQNNLDCYVKKNRSSKLIKNINQNLQHYSFSDVKNTLKDIQSKEGYSAQIYDMYVYILVK